MHIIDHGVWTRYTPENKQEHAPPSAVYAKREDGIDWYDYVRPTFKKADKTNFQPNSVICNINGNIVGAATRDATAIYAIDQRVIEIVDYEGDNPQSEFGGKVYDHTTQTFSDRPPLPPLPPTPTETRILGILDTIMERLDKLEKHKK